MSKRSISLLFLVAAIIVIAGLYQFVSEEPDSAPEVTSVDPGSGSDRPSSDGGEQPEPIQDSSASKAALRAPDRDQPARQPAELNPYESSSTARDFLVEAIHANPWPEEVVEANVRAWSRPCEEATRFGSYADLTADQRRNFGPAVAFGVGFWRYCDGLIDAETGRPDEGFLRDLREASSDPGDQAAYHWSRIADVNAVGDFDLLQDLAVSRLDRSLRQLDEASVRSSILELLRPQRPELVNLPPEIDVGEEAYSMLFSPVVHPVASALVCQELGGCYGANHPLVLRTCIEAMEQRIGCVNPTDLIDALYQTQTPIEHRLFWSLFDQVNGMLAAYRRRN